MDYQPLPLRVQRVKGKWEVPPDNKLLEGKIAGVIASQQLEQANVPGRDTRLAVRPALAPLVWIDGVTVGRKRIRTNVSPSPVLSGRLEIDPRPTPLP